MGVRLDGHVTFPNLGYKKDTFLEPSLVSNILFSLLTKTTTTTIPLECLLPHLPASRLLRSGLVQQLFVLLCLTGIL